MWVACCLHMSPPTPNPTLRTSCLSSVFGAPQYGSPPTKSVYSDTLVDQHTVACKDMVRDVTKQEGTFTDDEVGYIINALAFTPYHDSKITVDELRYWLMPGPPMMI